MDDLGARSGCHSNVREIKAVFVFFFIYLLTALLVSVVSFVVWGFIVHAGFESWLGTLCCGLSQDT